MGTGCLVGAQQVLALGEESAMWREAEQRAACPCWGVSSHRRGTLVTRAMSVDWQKPSHSLLPQAAFFRLSCVSGTLPCESRSLFQLEPIYQLVTPYLPSEPAFPQPMYTQ